MFVERPAGVNCFFNCKRTRVWGDDVVLDLSVISLPPLKSMAAYLQALDRHPPKVNLLA